MRKKLAAQLFTLRNEVKRDFPGTLKELKQMGWAGVQIDGLHGYDPREISGVMKEFGLQAAGMHVGLERMKHDLEAVLEEGRLFGTKDMICHSLPVQLQNEPGYRAVRNDLLDISKKVSPLGYRVGYHNHDFEFHTSVDGRYALDYLLEPDLESPIFAEIDTYWVKKAKVDPLSYIKAYSNRMPILHLKDMTLDESSYFTEIGNGVIDFAPIIRWGEANGVEWYAVEQDYCPGSPMESLAVSFENLMRISTEVE
ncbi:sugar phosphate isomerase/epimerase [Paenibacillus sp. LHD-117]|uniref:sugar phosphate isomerase/epimerase family protein n=1 Tax=Paenibacillus sp. LHD-117 TaxID=3071412 RepID=UPI0027E1A57F|nr:sugar phosphate isomerase/epimerase [Paenibacillus sp. LHD-117]MDQ6422299.1 sugar phosphate isomerase/epimerase [Paenibacillus sp. LHD-117]